MSVSSFAKKYELFTDEELYVLKRQCIEASFDIVMSGKYTELVKETHERLLNEIILEIKRRSEHANR